MRLAGWNLNDYRTTTEARGEMTRTCGADTFGGVGKISYIFKGHGKATLNYGNCHKKGKTQVYLNKHRMDWAYYTTNKEISFAYAPGDTLMIREKNQGVFIIYALKISCNGKTAPRRLADYNEGFRMGQRLSGPWDGK